MQPYVTLALQVDEVESIRVNLYPLISGTVPETIKDVPTFSIISCYPSSELIKDLLSNPIKSYLLGPEGPEADALNFTSLSNYLCRHHRILVGSYHLENTKHLAIIQFKHENLYLRDIPFATQLNELPTLNLPFINIKRQKAIDYIFDKLNNKLD